MQQFVAYDHMALRHCIHGLLVGAIQALAGAGRTVCDCTAAVPWECTMDMARQVWDKARHVDIFPRLLAHVEGYIGACLVPRSSIAPSPLAGEGGDGGAEAATDSERHAWPHPHPCPPPSRGRESARTSSPIDYLTDVLETTMLWRGAWAQTPEARVVGVNRELAGLAGDQLGQLIELTRQIGDPVIERTLDFVVADALTHVRLGRTWLRALPAAAPERLRKALECQQSIAE